MMVLPFAWFGSETLKRFTRNVVTVSAFSLSRSATSSARAMRRDWMVVTRASPPRNRTKTTAAATPT